MLSLDQLLAESADLQKKKKAEKRKASRPVTTTDYEQTKAELRKLKLARAVPKEIILRVHYQHCKCGEIITSVNSNPLVYKEGENFNHHEAVTREDLPKYAHLPRRTEARTVHIEACPMCFHLGDAFDDVRHVQDHEAIT